MAGTVPSVTWPAKLRAEWSWRLHPLVAAGTLRSNKQLNDGMSKGQLPPLKALRAFEASARHRSFTRAGEELRVTQSAISYQIRSLEAWLGFALFRRVNNTLLLTEKGEHYAALATRVLQDLLDGTAHIVETESLQTLTVHVRPHFAARWLVPRLAGFAAMHPDIQLRLITSHRGPEALEDEVDVAILTRQDVSGVRYDFLFDADIFPVCSPALLGRANIRDARDLLALPRLHVTSSSDEWSMLLAAAGIRDPLVDTGPRFETNELALVAAENGWGVAIGRWPFVESDIRAGRLTIPFGLRVKSPKSWFMICLENARFRKIEAFRNWIVHEAELTRRSMLQLADERAAVSTPGRHRPSQPLGKHIALATVSRPRD